MSCGNSRRSMYEEDEYQEYLRLAQLSEKWKYKFHPTNNTIQKADLKYLESLELGESVDKATKVRSKYLGVRCQKGNALPIITVTKLHTKSTNVKIGETYILVGRVKRDRSRKYEFEFIYDENFEYCLLWDLKLGQTFLDVVSRDDLCDEW